LRRCCVCFHLPLCPSSLFEYEQVGKKFEVLTAVKRLMSVFWVVKILLKHEACLF
jgi:hypothetical protein